MKYRIAHVGAFDFENFGDLLFTDVLEYHLKQYIEIEEIVYFAPKKCEMPGKDKQVYSVTELEKIAKEKKFDAIIVGGGDLVHMLKTKTYMPHVAAEGWVDYEVIYIWTIPSLVSEKLRIPLIWNAPGVPMFFTKENKLAVEILCSSVDYISVRDELSKEVLETAVDSDKIVVVPDTVLSIRDMIPLSSLERIFEGLGLPVRKKNYIFFQGNTTFSDEDIKICADTLLYLKQSKGYDIVLQPIGYALGDFEVLKKIGEVYPKEFIIPKKKLNQYEILSLIANSEIYIGSSLHGCITSNSYGVKNIVYNINHFRKTDGFVQLIGKESTRIYSSKEIKGTCEELRDISEDEMNGYIIKIKEHFKAMADIIKSGIKKETENVGMIAEYIYQNSDKVAHLETQVNQLLAENASLKEIKERADGLEKAYKEVISSMSWKITKPIRSILDHLK